MTGRLIAVVGPSGVGKDSVMAALVAARPDLHVVRRDITRAAGLGGEDYEALTEAEFERRARAGDYALHWQAHGLSYGIPVAVEAVLASGRDALVNLSRAVLVDAQKRFPGFVVLSLTASPEALRARLEARGRETPESIEARLARADRALPKGLPVLSIDNSGPLQDTVQTALGALYPVNA